MPLGHSLPKEDPSLGAEDGLQFPECLAAGGAERLPGWPPLAPSF